MHTLGSRGRPAHILLTAFLVASAALAFGLVPATDAATTGPSIRALLPADLWGFVVARRPTTASYTPAAKDQGDSAGMSSKVTRTGVGSYDVMMTGLLPSVPNWGDVQVTPLGTALRTCEVGDFGSGTVGTEIQVECFTRTGVAVNTAFIVNYVNLHSASGRAGYVWGNDPTNPSYTPDTTYQFNSTGATNTISRLSTGRYQVHLPGLGANHGNALVSAEGNTGAGCRIPSWGPSGGDLVVNVLCRTHSGAPSDELFMMLFTQGEGLKGPGGTPAAYLNANHPTLAAYTADAAYRYSSAGIAPKVARSGLGVYTVTLGGMQPGGAAQVTAYGSGMNRCVVSSIPGSGSPLKIGVRCFNVNGSPADTKFGLSFVH